MDQDLPQAVPNEDEEGFLREVGLAVGASDFPRAYRLAREGLDRGIRHPLLLHLRGHALVAEGRLPEALADLEAAKQLAPADSRIHNGLGETLFSLSRPHDAIKAFDAALGLDPSFALAHYNRGCAIEMIGELETAERSYRRAVALDINYADPLARLASLENRRSNWARAHALADRALMLSPGHYIATIARAEAYIGEKRLDEAESCLAAILDEPRRGAHERAVTLSLLGDIRDRQDRVDEAFALYSDTNALLLTEFAPRYANGPKETARQLIARLSLYFSAADAGAWAKPDVPAPAVKAAAAGLVFVVGFPRSGTTLLGQILAAHPDVVTLDEKIPLVDSIRDFIENPDGLDKLATLSQEELSPYREKYWNHVRNFGLHLRDKVLVDKLPLNLLRLPLIARLFPDAKIVLCIRDPRDVVFSAFRRMFAIHPFSYELLALDGTARFYGEVMRVGDLYRAKLPLHLHEIRNEDLIADFDGQTRALCKFVGIPWKESMRAFAAQSKRRMIATPSANQITSGLSGESVGQWRRYRAHLAPVLPILQPWVDRFGYPAD
jgi:tetratricopeptide (TPR) repeat protein